MNKGLFITFEGVEGAGKSTQVRLLVERLQQAGYHVVATREPGGTSLGDAIRSLVLEKLDAAIDPTTEALLMCASRAQLVRQVIRPQLEQGCIVICDRYSDSTYAYQGYGRGLDLAALRAVNEFATGGLLPDLTVLLDLDPALGLARRFVKEGQANRLDRLDLDFHQRVREGYLNLSKESTRWYIVDAAREPSAVATAIWEAVAPILAKWIASE